MDSTTPSIELNQLPPMLRMLVRCMGESDAFKLVESLGGTKLRVPQAFVEGHLLLDVISVRAFLGLINEYGGIDVQLPKYDSVLRQIRHKRVNALLDQGLTNKEVALATNYTQRQVINIKQQAHPIGRQISLWDALQADADDHEQLDQEPDADMTVINRSLDFE